MIEDEEFFDPIVENYNKPDHHKYPIVRCDPANPNRCKADLRSGQCEFLSIEGTQYCARHGGISQKDAQLAQNNRKYKLTHLKDLEKTVDQYKHDKEILNLRDDIALLRGLIQEKLNTCTTTTELMLASGLITAILRQVSDTTEKCFKLEQSLGRYLDKSELIAFVQQIIEVINIEISDDTVKFNLGQKILGLIPK